MSKLFIFSGEPGGDINRSRHLKAGAGIKIAQSGHDATVVSDDSISNIGSSGVGLFKQKVGGQFQIRKIVGKGNTIVTQTADTITIRS